MDNAKLIDIFYPGDQQSSRTAPSPESAWVEWRQRLVIKCKPIILHVQCKSSLWIQCYIILSPPGESSTVGPARRHICRHRQRHSSQSNGPRHHWHCGGKESGHLLLWSETCRQVTELSQDNSMAVIWFGKHVFTTPESHAGILEKPWNWHHVKHTGILPIIKMC